MRARRSMWVFVAALVVGVGVLASGVEATHIINEDLQCSSFSPPNCVDTFFFNCNHPSTVCAEVDFLDTAGADDDIRGVLTGLQPASVGVRGQTDTAVDYNSSGCSGCGCNSCGCFCGCSPCGCFGCGGGVPASVQVCRPSTAGPIQTVFSIFVQSATAGSFYQASFFCRDAAGNSLGQHTVNLSQDQ